MGKNLKRAEEYLISQDKAFREKLTFIETRGSFFEKILNSLEDWKVKYRLILNEFYCSANRLPKFYPNNVPLDRVADEVREWPQLSSLQSIEQPMSQEKILSACESIFLDSYNMDVDIEYAIINFREGTLSWRKMIYLLSHSIVNIEVASGQKESYDFRLGDRLDAAVYIRDRGSFVEAYLNASGPDGKEHFFMLNHFSILFFLDARDEDVEEELRQYVTKDDGDMGEKTPVEDIKSNGDIGIFTLFDKAKSLFFTTTYWHSLPFRIVD